MAMPTKFEKKSTILIKIGDELINRSKELGELLCREEGKTLPEGIGEVARAGQQFQYYGAECLRMAGEKIPSTRPGFQVEITREPIGVIGIIFESRPNVTCDAAALCFKTSNAVILRGGKEAIHSNLAIAQALQEGGENKGLPKNAIQLVSTTDRDAVRELCRMTKYLDLIIPRGGEGLINAVTEMALVPVIKHYKGICHTYVDATADLDMALAITENANDIRVAINERKSFIMRTAFIVAVVIFIFSYVLNRFFLKPIKNLVNYTNIIKEKSTMQTNIEAIKKRNDELGTLSKSLDAMTNDLQKRIETAENFSTDLVHEIRNPLASLKSASEIISDTDSNEQRQKLIKIIYLKV